MTKVRRSLDQEMERQRRYQDKHVNEDLPVLLIGDTVRVARFPGFKKWLHATGNNRHQWPRSDVAEHNGESTDATDDTSTVNDRGRPNTLTNRASNQDQAQPIDIICLRVTQLASITPSGQRSEPIARTTNTVIVQRSPREL